MSQAVPELIKRFRAREVRRLIDRGRLPQRDPNGPPGTWRVPAKPMTLHNPFLPRPLFDPSTRAPAESSAREDASAEKKSVGTQKKKEKTKEKKERKKWAQPHYSLRRQADLVKLARASGTLHLLPPGPKLSVQELAAAKREVELRIQSSASTANVRDSIETATATSTSETKGDASSSQAVEASSMTPPEDAPVKSVRETRTVAIRGSTRRSGFPGVVFNWTGKAPQKPRKRLTIYVGRRRMFKGHKWERHLDKRRAKIAVRMRDMPQRIRRFKNVSHSVFFLWPLSPDDTNFGL